MFRQSPLGQTQISANVNAWGPFLRLGLAPTAETALNIQPRRVQGGEGCRACVSAHRRSRSLGGGARVGRSAGRLPSARTRMTVLRPIFRAWSRFSLRKSGSSEEENAQHSCCLAKLTASLSLCGGKCGFLVFQIAPVSLSTAI